MNDKELWELMSIICEGQDSEQRRQVEQYITDLQKEIERLKEKTNKLEEEPLTHTMGRIDSVVSNIYRNNKEKDKEIERLNNIINELEKELDLNLPFKVVGVRHLKKRLQELKGSDKNV